MSLFYDKEEYELTSSTEIETLLAELPFDLIKESILEQIDDPIRTTTNYIDIVLDKCEIYREDFANNEELLSELNERMTDFFISIISAISSKFDLGLDINGIALYNDAVEKGESIYRYFILQYTKNITNFIINYIDTYKETLCDYYMNNISQNKDVSTLAYKKQIKDPEDLCIITNLPSIIKYIINLDISSSEFINLSSDYDNYDAYIVSQLISKQLLIGDFYNNYMSFCVDSYEYIIDELQTDIKTEIMKNINN